MNLADARTLLQLARGMPRSGALAQRLAAFYGPQAGHYDGFRERLLAGRADLLQWLAPQPGEAVVELGAGTGRNPEYLGPGLPALRQLTLVDLCAPLLEIARRRWQAAPNVRVVEADACSWQPAQPVDAVYLAYALTMIPDWRATMENAVAMLRPGGRLGVVDFTLAANQPWLAQTFWRGWFGHDGVRLNADHTAMLMQLLPQHELSVRRARVPYLPGLRVPYYLFLGHKQQ
ncbi:MAG: class I SAM-dependent methyltransferase [Rhodocyclaceae bacterium]|nr:MAG: class I SAM-dependent methyltransferase [Rhodocyclaceae bacterium]